MLRLVGGQVESLWDEDVAGRARELPRDLEALDVLLSDPALLAPVTAHWEREALVSGRAAAGHGRPTIPIETYLRLKIDSTVIEADVRYPTDAGLTLDGARCSHARRAR